MIVGTKPKQVEHGDVFRDIETGKIYTAAFTDNSKMNLFVFYDHDILRKFESVPAEDMLQALEKSPSKLKYLGNKKIEIVTIVKDEKFTAEEVLNQVIKEMRQHGSVVANSKADVMLMAYKRERDFV